MPKSSIESPTAFSRETLLAGLEGLSESEILDFSKTAEEVARNPRKQRLLFQKLLSLSARDNLNHYNEFVSGFKPRPHHEIWNEALMGSEDLLIIAPFGHGKTETLKSFASWTLGRDPSKHILYLSAVAQQADKTSVATRDLIESSIEFRAVFPTCVPNKTKGWSEDEWYLQRPRVGDKDASFFASGVNSSRVLGSRCEIQIWDDVGSQENQSTPYQQEKLLDWLKATALSRLDPEMGRLVAIMTRWSRNDPATLFEYRAALGKQVKVIHMPALGYWEELAGLEVLDWMDAEPLWPEKQSKRQLISLMAEDPERFALSYQGDVDRATGQIFKEEYWRYYHELPDDPPILKIQFWDTAFKETQTADYSVCLTWYVYQDAVFLVDRLKVRAEYPKLLRLSVAQFELHRPDLVLIEEKASGISLIQSLQATTLLPILAWPADRDLVSRAHAVTGLLAAGRVFLPASAGWLKDFKEEHRVFPDPGIHDDQVACTVGSLEWLQRSPIRIDPVQYLDTYALFGDSIPTIDSGLGSPLALELEERGFESLELAMNANEELAAGW